MFNELEGIFLAPIFKKKWWMIINSGHIYNRPSEAEEEHLHYLAREIVATSVITYYEETLENIENYMDSQLQIVILNFVKSSQELKDLASPRIFPKVPRQCFAPLWLATKETTVDEFRAMFLASSSEAKKMCDDTEKAINAYLRNLENSKKSTQELRLVLNEKQAELVRSI